MNKKQPDETYRRTAFVASSQLMDHVADDVPTAPEQNGGAADP